MSFQQGLSGLNAASRQLDVIGNNVSNASTVGFKASEAIFSDVYANSIGTTASSSTGLGVTVASVQTNFGQGNITSTTNPLDIAINGAGFFRMDTNGVASYSRSGQFHIDKDGYISNPTGSKLTGYTIDNNGRLLIGANAGPLKISTSDIMPKATTEGHITLNLDSREAAIAIPFNVNDPRTYNKTTAMTVFDSLGNAHTQATYYVKTAANTWSVYGSTDGAAGVNLGTLTFKADGTLDTTATTLPFNASSAVTSGATSPMAFTIDYYGSTQFGSEFGVSSLLQDGSTSGKLAGVSAASDGTIVGRYSNGQSRTLGQIALANFSTPEGLSPMSNNLWAETAASGQPLIGVPGSSNLGVVQSGAVEESNVDLTKELVNMITAQRYYQANAQTIKTQDQVLNTLVNLR